MNDNNGYVWGGAIAGLLVIAAIGIVLAQRQGRLRETLAVHVGLQPARGLVYLVWFAYVYSALNAFGQASSIIPSFHPEAETPPVLAFLYGSVWHALLAFVNALVPVVQIAALCVAAFVLYRHGKAEPSS
jgi:ABC-type Fe3+-siderophore transport system permease subunit